MKATLRGKTDFKTGVSKKGNAYAFTTCYFTLEKSKDAYGQPIHGEMTKQLSIGKDMCTFDSLIIGAKYDLYFDDEGALESIIPLDTNKKF